ncbi:MAG TPA: hypothetical protein VHS78_02605 [Candidatus Elarobacter sp.]|nr:hypothetical protein [Candidatus Elarobacter sp.]
MPGPSATTVPITRNAGEALGAGSGAAGVGAGDAGDAVHGGRTATRNLRRSVRYVHSHVGPRPI